MNESGIVPGLEGSLKLFVIEEEGGEEALNWRLLLLLLSLVEIVVLLLLEFVSRGLFGLLVVVLEVVIWSDLSFKCHPFSAE